MQVKKDGAGNTLVVLKYWLLAPFLGSGPGGNRRGRSPVEYRGNLYVRPSVCSPGGPLQASPGTSEASLGLPEASPGLSEASPGLSEVCSGLSEVSPGLSKTSPGLSETQAF